MPIKVIVHTGVHSLKAAKAYYQQFPLEPSPAGDLDLDKANFVEIENMAFDKLLGELAKGPTGGTVLIVCHAHDESGSVLQSSGLFMPLAADSGLSAQDDAFQALIEAGPAVKKAKEIRAMPSKTDEDKKAKDQAWRTLANNFALGFPPDNATLDQLDKFFEKGLDDVARKTLQLRGGAASLKKLLTLIEQVQARQLARVEFRACKIGKDTDTLKHLKTLFGCGKLLAPKARTFYITHMPINTLDDFDHLYINEHRGNFPTRESRSFKDPTDFAIDVFRKDPKARIFWDVEYGYIPPAGPKDGLGTSTIKLKAHVLAMIVEEVAPSQYRASAGAWREDSRHKPTWADASAFVHQYIMETAKYSSGDPMISGFWTPDRDLSDPASVPWLLPHEPDYVDQINQV